MKRVTAKEILDGLLALKRELNYQESYGNIVLKQLSYEFDKPIGMVSDKDDIIEFTLKTFQYVIEQNDKILNMLLLIGFYLAGQGTVSIPKNFLEGKNEV